MQTWQVTAPASLRLTVPSTGPVESPLQSKLQPLCLGAARPPQHARTIPFSAGEHSSCLHGFFAVRKNYSNKYPLCTGHMSLFHHRSKWGSSPPHQQGVALPLKLSASLASKGRSCCLNCHFTNFLSLGEPVSVHLLPWAIGSSVNGLLSTPCP